MQAGMPSAQVASSAPEDGGNEGFMEPTTLVASLAPVVGANVDGILKPKTLEASSAPVVKGTRGLKKIEQKTLNMVYCNISTWGPTAGVTCPTSSVFAVLGLG